MTTTSAPQRLRTRTGRVTHLAEGEWRVTYCGRPIAELIDVPLEQRSGDICKVCERERQAFKAWEADYAERQRAERVRTVRMNAETMERISATLDLIEQKQRASALAAGRDPDRPKESAEQIRAKAERLRKANDEALERMRATLPKSRQSGRRSTHLRAVPAS